MEQNQNQNLNKLFVGNLNFKTNPDELGNLFAEIGEVAEVKIISRDSMSLGYGFVQMKNPDDVARAQAAMDKKELDGRMIHVEVARPHVPRQPGEARPVGAPGAPGARRPRRPFPRGPRQGYGYGYPPQFYYGPYPPYGGQFPPQGYPQQQQQPQGPVPAGAVAPGQRPRRFTRRPRAPRPDRSNDPLSKTRLFVANIPFSMTSEQLAQEFSQFGVKEAHIATRPPNGYSRGYGFIELNNEADQQRAIDAMNEKEVSGRKILVRVGREPQPRPVADAPVAPIEGAPAAPEAAKSQ